MSCETLEKIKFEPWCAPSFTALVGFQWAKSHIIVYYFFFAVVYSHNMEVADTEQLQECCRNMNQESINEHHL